jgi:6-phosphogluconolactonase
MFPLHGPFRLLAFSLLCAGILTGAEMNAPSNAAMPAATDTIVYVGTYTGRQSKGIYAYRLDAKAAAAGEAVLQPLGLAVETPSPSFLVVEPKRRLVFAANEIDSFEGKTTGAVSAFAVDAATGKLKLINQQPSMGTGPCHVALDRDGKFLFVANYNSGSFAVLPVAADGRLGAPTTVIQNAGKSVNAERQSGPHAHGITFDPANRFVFFVDLGLDQILGYRFDSTTGKLTPTDPAFAAVKAGSGCRHLVFRPDGKFAYAMNEMASTVTVFSYDANKGKLTEVQSLSALPPGSDAKSSGAEIAVHPSGKWLYASNRGHDSVTQFEIDQQKGTITFAATQPSGGKIPRHFAFFPSGKQLAVANQNSNSILLCRADEKTGRLQAAGAPIDVPSPVCVVFLPPSPMASAR